MEEGGKPLFRLFYNNYIIIILIVQIFDCSKSLLLQLATPDAIIRGTRDRVVDAERKLQKIYFEDQQHSSLSALITGIKGSLLQVRAQCIQKFNFYICTIFKCNEFYL